MTPKLSLTLLAGMLSLAMTPMVAAAQESAFDAPGHEPPSAAQPQVEVEMASSSNLAALRRSTESAALVAPPTADRSTADAVGLDDESVPANSAAPSKGSGTGLGFMIGGAAAFVGGLLIGGTAGTIIAAGGVGLGVYGAIIYF